MTIVAGAEGNEAGAVTENHAGPPPGPAITCPGKLPPAPNPEKVCGRPEQGQSSARARPPGPQGPRGEGWGVWRSGGPAAPPPLGPPEAGCGFPACCVFSSEDRAAAGRPGARNRTFVPLTRPEPELRTAAAGPGLAAGGGHLRPHGGRPAAGSEGGEASDFCLFHRMEKTREAAHLGRGRWEPIGASPREVVS